MQTSHNMPIWNIDWTRIRCRHILYNKCRLLQVADFQTSTYCGCATCGKSAYYGHISIILIADNINADSRAIKLLFHTTNHFTLSDILMVYFTTQLDRFTAGYHIFMKKNWKRTVSEDNEMYISSWYFISQILLYILPSKKSLQFSE